MNIKNKNSIVTIVTPDYLHAGLATLRSARKYNKNIDCIVLYLGEKCEHTIKNITILTIKDIEIQYNHIAQKYGYNTDETRWSLKPIALLYLLNIYYKVIYVDPDILFVNDWNFLYDQIDSMLLSPHFVYLNNYEHSAINAAEYGYFNAGFVGVSRFALEPLRYWANLCFKKCEHKNGLYVDQKYLDIIFMMNQEFDGIKQINNIGCNIARWNLHKNLDTYKNIFYHFSTINYNDINIFKYSQFIYYHQYHKKLSEKIKKCLLKK
jgi:hypothetical protein